MRHNIVLAAAVNQTPTPPVRATIHVSKAHDPNEPLDARAVIKGVLDASREAMKSSQTAILSLGSHPGRKRLLDVCQFIDRAPGPIGMSSLVDTLTILDSRLSATLVPTTVRDIYYHHVDTYKHQQQRCVANLTAVATALNLDLRAQLMIHPLQKGIMYGSFSFLLDGNRHCLNYQDEPVLVPLLFPRVLSVPKDSSSSFPKAIIVVEKEAVFKSFCYHLRQGTGPSGLLVVTGKGYPDNLTREFIKSVATITRAPVIVFVDADVYGAGICLQYARDPPNPPLTYGGTKILDFDQGWLQINRRDVCCAMSMMKSDFSGLRLLKRDVQRELLLFLKAEMDVVSSGESPPINCEFPDVLTNDLKSSKNCDYPVPLPITHHNKPPKTALGCARYMSVRIEAYLQLHNST